MLQTFLFLATSSLPVATAQAPAQAQVVTRPELGLTFDFTFLTGFSKRKEGTKEIFAGRFGESEVLASLETVDLSTILVHEPEDVVELARDRILDDAEQVSFVFEPLRAVRGPFGSAPILAITRAEVVNEDSKHVADSWVLGGLLPKVGWWLGVDATPPLTPEAREELTKKIEGCAAWKGSPRDPRWTEVEAKAWYDALAPKDARKDFQKPVRTEHFIVLSPHKSANQYAKKLEAWYAEIAKILPMEESKDRRLLPVLLFRHADEFARFYADRYSDDKNEIDFESWCGGAWYATHFDNDSEYDNRMELTKFLLVNRVRGWSACNWFRNGLRDLCATRANERSLAVRAVKKGRATPLEKLFRDDAWGARARRVEKTGADEEVDYWDQSCLWMEFLSESKSTKPKFPGFVREMSAVAEGDIDRVKAILIESFGMDVPALENALAEYCQTRK